MSPMAPPSPVSARDAWLGGLMGLSAGASEVRVGVIDGPVDLEHPAFADQLPRFSTAETEAFRCARPSAAACEHGTMVFGILAARRGTPAPALCPESTFVLRPIFAEETDRGAAPSALAAAIRDLVRAEVHVINVSAALANVLACPPSVHAALDEAGRRGVVVVVASGNDGRLGAGPLLEHEGVIPVAAGDALGRPLPLSNLGPSIARRGLLAPGSGVISTVPGGEYRPATGTSVAAPFVTAALALLLAIVPTATPARVRAALLGLRKPGRVVPPRLDARAALARLSSDSRSFPLSGRSLRVSTEPSETADAAIPAHPASLREAKPLAQPASHRDSAAAVRPAGSDGPCACQGAAGAPPSYVYAIGHIETRFPTTSVEQEYRHVYAGMPTAGQDEGQIRYDLLKNNRYLARELCWVLLVEGHETYLLVPRDPSLYDSLIEALRPGDPSTRLLDRDVVIGVRGPIAPPGMCKGLEIPVCGVDRIYSFDRTQFLKSIPRAPDMPDDVFERQADGLLARVEQLADNVGASDRDRAYNFLVTRYDRIYALVAERSTADFELKSIEAQPSRLSETGRTLVNVILTFVHRKTDVEEKYYVRVDVTEKYPFLAGKLQTFYDR